MDDLVETSRKPSAAAPHSPGTGELLELQRRVRGPFPHDPTPGRAGRARWMSRPTSSGCGSSRCSRRPAPWPAGSPATAGTSHNPFAIPNPRAAIDECLGLVHGLSDVDGHEARLLVPGHAGRPGLWAAFQRIGVDGVHTGPVKRAGGLSGVEATPSVDGYFDRISTDIDDAFGTEAEYRRLCEVAARHAAAVIDDIVPGHTGKGADFRLAEMKVGDYPGIYHMVEIPPADWHLLPEVPPARTPSTSPPKPRTS